MYMLLDAPSIRLDLKDPFSSYMSSVCPMSKMKRPYILCSTEIKLQREHLV